MYAHLDIVHFQYLRLIQFIILDISTSLCRVYILIHVQRCQLVRFCRILYVF